ncbi:hypothetical protein M23134_04496 [Microscilla marina ATCC 23134]|uniref:Uncharacterized protein n=1 Tax=Microscilla marina ATCC 23134 TaxID=313606 RepID=A1ZW78_MICM2|nr:hypothetical protein M23134_04496 [Microscilla marina ATCC 23134]
MPRKKTGFSTGLILANIAIPINRGLSARGAIMAALPLLLQIVGAIFTGIGILDMAKHFGKYLSQAFPDKTIAGGAKSLARGLAALTIELIFSLLFGGKALLKSAKKGIKTVAKKGVKGAVKAGTKAARKSAVKGIKNTAQNLKDLGGVARDGWGALMKNGKMIFKGAKRGVISGAKTLDDVAKRLAKKFRFKKFKIVIKKRRFQILGEFKFESQSLASLPTNLPKKTPRYLAYVSGQCFGRTRTCTFVEQLLLKRSRLPIPPRSVRLREKNSLLSNPPITFTRDPCSATELRPSIGYIFIGLGRGESNPCTRLYDLRVIRSRLKLTL